MKQAGKVQKSPAEHVRFGEDPFRIQLGNTKKSRGRPSKIDGPRCQAERTFAWFQQKYRCLAVR